MADVDVLREIDPAARIAPDATIGPFCVIGPNVTIGPRSVIGSRVTVTGNTTIGSGNRIGDGSVLGAHPQDLKYRGANTLLIIGHNNVIGRLTTMHVGTEPGGYVTRVGDSNTLREGVHIAHDCFVDNHVTLGRGVQLAGHILVQDGAVIDDLSGVHHFVTIGRYARITARTPVRRDVPPFTVFGTTASYWDAPAVTGTNEDGIDRAELKKEEAAELRRALADLFEDEAALQTKIEQLENLGVEGEAARLCEFCQQSLQGKFGRIRESYRGQVPPEAKPYLRPDILAAMERNKT